MRRATEVDVPTPHLARKEIENYLLVPSALQRVIRQRIASPRTDPPRLRKSLTNSIVS